MAFSAVPWGIGVKTIIKCATPSRNDVSNIMIIIYLLSLFIYLFFYKNKALLSLFRQIILNDWSERSAVKVSFSKGQLALILALTWQHQT